jgi:hypothetical protein
MAQNLISLKKHKEMVKITECVQSIFEAIGALSVGMGLY